MSDTNSLCDTKQYEETIKYISCLSKEELITNIKHMISILKEDESVPEVIEFLQKYMDEIKDASLEIKFLESPKKTNYTHNDSRYKFLEV